MDPNSKKKEAERIRNRRRALRRLARRSTKIACFRGSLGMGKNLGISLLDISETGVRLHVKAPFEEGEDLEVNLLGLVHARPIRVLCKVIWCMETKEGNFIVGAEFEKSIRYRDVLEL